MRAADVRRWSWSLVVMLVFAACADADPHPSRDGGGGQGADGGQDGGSGGDGGGVPPDDPFIIAIAPLPLAGTPLDGALSLHGSVTRVDVVHRATADDAMTEKVITVFEGATPIEFSIDLTIPYRPTTVAVLEVPPGYVSQVRFVTFDGSVTFPSGSRPVKIPSGEQSGLKLVPTAPETAFRSQAGAITAILADLDGGRQIVENKGQGLLFKPVLRGHTVAPSDIAPNIINNQVRVRFKDGTSRAEIDAAIQRFDARTRVLSGLGGVYFALEIERPLLLSDAMRYFDGLAIVDYTNPADIVQLASHDVPSDGDSWEYFNVRAYDAHDPVTGIVGNKKQTIAIVDSGTDFRNFDLVRNTWINEAELPAELRATGPGGGSDFDGDGVVTFYDWNPNKILDPPLSDEQKALLGKYGIGDPSRGHPGFIDGADLVYAINTNMMLSDPDGDGNKDDDGNGLMDDIVGWDFVDNDNDPTLAESMSPGGDIVRHGLEVAGMAAAAFNNAGYGVAGVSPVARVPIVRVCGASKGCTKWRDGTFYAGMSGFDIMNGSWGALNHTGIGETIIPKESRPLCAGLNPAVDPGTYKETKKKDEAFWRDSTLSKMLIVRSAGNCDVTLSNARRPAIFSIGLGIPGITNVISVTSVVLQIRPDLGKPQNVFEHAVKGSDIVDIAAPGEDVTVLGLDADDGRESQSRIGTSYASPMVAGAAALVLAKDPSLRGNPTAIRARLLSNAAKGIAQPAGAVRDGNRLDVCKAVGNGTCPH